MTRPSTRSRVLVFLFLAAAALLLAGSFFAARWVDEPRGEPQEAAGPAASQDVAVSAPPRNFEPSTREAGMDAEEEAERREHDHHAAIRRYKQLTRYPGSSRRLTRDSVDLLDPNRRYERRGPVPTDEDEEPIWEVLYTADRYFVRGREPLSISLALWRDGEPVLPRGVELRAEPVGPGAAGRVRIPTQVHGGQISAVLVPEEHWPHHLGPIRVAATFSAEGLREKTGLLTFYFTPELRVPGRFTGSFREGLSPEGDLVIEVGLEIATPGTYRVEGNLFDRDGRPVAWARFEGELSPGVQNVPLEYYGLVFHDADARPPFVLRDLRGHRLSPGDAPDRADLATYPGEYETIREYVRSDFRSTEHDSPKKQRMLELYRDALERGVRLTDPGYVGTED